MKKIIERWKAPTPSFFKKVIKAGIGIGALGIGILGLPATIPGLILPAIITTVATHAAAVGGTAALIAKLTKMDINKDSLPNPKKHAAK